MKTIYSMFLKRSLVLVLTLISFLAFSQDQFCNVTVIKGKNQYRYSDSFTDYEVQTKGKIKVNDDDTRIVSISPGGYLKISKKTFGNKRSLIVESSAGGKLNYEYYEGRSEVPFEPEGRKWLADILLDVVRMTGIDADGRTKRIYQNEGIDGFLEEVHQIASNSISALYFENLLENYKLNENELVSVCRAISDEISSNSERGRLYRRYSGRFMASNTLAVQFFESVSGLSSNTERGSVLRSIEKPIDFNDNKVTEAYFDGVDKLTSNTEAGSVIRNLERSQSLSNIAYVRLLVSVKKLSSNTEMGSVMRSLKDIDMTDPDITDAWFNAIDAMSSNTEAGSTMRHLMSNHTLDDRNYLRLLGSVKKLSSNTEAGSILRSARDINLGNPEISNAYFIAISTMSSNTEMGSVLRHTIKNYSLNHDSWKTFLMTAGKMSSSSEMGSVLRAAQEEMTFDGEVMETFFAAANQITSNTEKGRVLRAVASNPKVNREAILGVINSSRIMSSNTEKSSVLRTVAKSPFVKDDEVKSAYMSAARTLSSDTEYRSTVDALID